ncbi:EamA family transporter [Bacillus aquiflavi]|uniref:EamA family transporter n=1 Tax=Bacillus aquiflavi TaxID=2672567 RepID=A0A6B3W0S7_9BACI|nr:EamA family transporter [Bacillus aquiflavi]MBA4537861.1 EamA family transporter [Bacillus aquiflavi]NEY82117.1 EamA family transporter [Bacillus aquiflavi]
METKVLIRSHGRLKGISFVLFAAILWGVSGTVAQYLFQHKGYSPEWLVVVRLLISGVFFLLLSIVKGNRKIFEIWKSKEERSSLLLFSIVGMLGVQYTFFAAINVGNAATATLLQYLAPVMIVCYFAIKLKRSPSINELLAILLALLGAFLLVTKGNFQHLSISGWAVFWGISSAFALAFYTLQPINLLRKWGSIIVIGWGMFVGGLAFSFLSPPWKFQGELSFEALVAVLFIVLFGTLIPFYCYLESLKYISATETSLLASAEPLSAALLAVLWLRVPFGLVEWLGAACIIGTIIILSQADDGDVKRSK